MKLLMFAFIIPILFTSCNKIGQPTCTDTEVQETLFEIVRGRIEKQYEQQYSYENWNYSDLQAYAEDNGLNAEEFIKNKREEFEKESKIYASDMASKVEIKLVNPRLTEVEEKLRKCGCTSELQIKINGEVTHNEYNYSAQYTEDNKVYVELFFK